MEVFMYNSINFNTRADSSLRDEGQLQIGVFSGNISTPLDNATIKIISRGDNTNIVDEEISNISGQSPIVNLPAPSLEYSLDFESQNQPFSEYDVLVTVDGYRPTLIEGVQIFPHTVATQNVYMQPGLLTNNMNIITINKPTLWGSFPPKIIEDPIKELPESLGYVVLPEPVVPEFVIVHDGVPSDASATNYWVRFTDYVKNVASCEIYSTWPEETIKANVLAIISFTLNRIYTEWYRGKGYDFTITNSTAYDQAFDYGRNIFKEISTIVDNIFTTFVTKPDIRQPLFTQYCDGKRVSCPNWMSQWGSKYLGDQGYNAVDILKNYYGQEIYLMNAKEVEGVPSSFPGTGLQMGSRGPDVRTKQEQLNAISNNYPAIKKIRVDSIYGDETRLAVETFQDIFRLPSTGIIDFATWYRISDIYVAVTRMAELA